MGISVEGTLNQVEGEFNFDPTDPEKSAIQLQFALSGLSTGNRLRDRHLRSSDYFDAAQWPNIVFSSDSVVAKGPEQWVLHGQLRIKGVKRKLSLPFELKKRPLGGFEAVGLTTLNRREYGVGGKSFILSDEVRVKILVLLP
jgi:polyisoprenoid-binding protein YceI